jgi:hypothetical protein
MCRTFDYLVPEFSQLLQNLLHFGKSFEHVWVLRENCPSEAFGVDNCALSQSGES